MFVSATDTGTSPGAADSDGDGFDDADEIAQGTDPTDSLDFPGAPAVPGLGWLGRMLIVAGLSLVGVRMRGRVARSSA